MVWWTLYRWRIYEDTHSCNWFSSSRSIESFSIGYLSSFDSSALNQQLSIYTRLALFFYSLPYWFYLRSLAGEIYPATQYWLLTTWPVIDAITSIGEHIGKCIHSETWLTRVLGAILEKLGCDTMMRCVLPNKTQCSLRSARISLGICQQPSSIPTYLEMW